jgi:hypothetical protein
MGRVARVEQLFEAIEIDATKGERRVNTLFLLGGSDLQRIHKTLPVDVPAASGEAPERTDYDKAIYHLNVYFNPMRNKNVEQYLFSGAKQDESETITQYVTRLRILATYCEFADDDTEIVRQVIKRCVSSKLQRSYLKEVEIDIEKILSLVRIHDTLDNQVSIVEGKEPEANHVYFIAEQSDEEGKQSERAQRFKVGGPQLSFKKRGRCSIQATEFILFIIFLIFYLLRIRRIA